MPETFWDSSFTRWGDVGCALIQWVISINLQPDNNRADHYLDEVQRKPGQLEIASQMVKKFNQALFYAQNDSDDLAVLQLKRIVDEKPNFVKAHLLLALLYMEHGDYVKAGKSPGQGAPDRQTTTRRPPGTWSM